MTQYSRERGGLRSTSMSELSRCGASKSGAGGTVGRYARQAIRRSLQRMRTDRRGATAVIFGLSATIVIGMVGLGTEGGTWYLTKRDAQNAADTAAYAGALRLSYAQDQLGAAIADAQSQGRTAANETAASNGFTTGQSNTTVQALSPPTSGTYAGVATAVQVIVTRTRPRLISALFLGADPVISVRGVAAVTSLGKACLVASPGSNVTGQLILGGNTTATAPNCVLASNATGSNAISITGSASVTAGSLTSVGGCVGCAAATLSSPYTTYSVTTSNPLAHLDHKQLPAFNSTSCYRTPVYTPAGVVTSIPNNNTISSSLVVPPPPAGKAICGLKTSGSSTVLTLNPGTYYFYDGDFDIGGGTVECRMPTTPPTANGALCSGGYGVTIVFTGTPSAIGGPKINSNATVQLSAPSAAHAADPDFAGILFFRDPRATGGNTQGNSAVQINGGANTVLTGAMYFPNSYVKYNGNAAVNSCSVLIGGTVELTGNSGLNVSQCTQLGYGSVVPQLKIVRLME